MIAELLQCIKIGLKRQPFFSSIVRLLIVHKSTITNLLTANCAASTSESTGAAFAGGIQHQHLHVCPSDYLQVVGQDGLVEL